MTTTRIFTESVAAYLNGYRIIPNRGGTRSGKTFSVMQFLILKAARKKVSIDIVSESIPHLKRGCLQDFETITEALEMIENQHFTRNRTDNTITFQDAGTMRFFSADDWGKIKGSRREILFINECNRLPFEVFRQLEVRTTECIFLDWNPDSEFWFEQQGVKTRPDTAPEIVSTYKDNIDNLTPQQIAAIEANRNDTNWWTVYGLGQVGKKQGLIYKNWEICHSLPNTYKLAYIGLDFGFTNDPTAIVLVVLAHGELYLHEISYLKGQTNDRIAQTIKGCKVPKFQSSDVPKFQSSDVSKFQSPSVSKLADTGTLEHWNLQKLPIIADSAEPKSIAELRSYGLNVEPALKGADSIQNGIDILQRYKLNITADSLNLLDEIRHYCYKEDAFGNPTNKPIDKYNHALDAVRYVALNKLIRKPSNRGCHTATLL